MNQRIQTQQHNSTAAIIGVLILLVGLLALFYVSTLQVTPDVLEKIRHAYGLVRKVAFSTAALMLFMAAFWGMKAYQAIDDENKNLWKRISRVQFTLSCISICVCALFHYTMP